MACPNLNLAKRCNRLSTKHAGEPPPLSSGPTRWPQTWRRCLANSDRPRTLRGNWRARWKLDYYQRVTDQHARDPLQAQVNKLTGERDRWQAQAEDLAQRVKTLEWTLAQMPPAYDAHNCPHIIVRVPIPKVPFTRVYT